MQVAISKKDAPAVKAPAVKATALAGQPVSSIPTGPKNQQYEALPLPLPPAAVPTATVPKAGSFICYLCTRKFNSEEGLANHEKLSDLHKRNLALATMKEVSRED